MIPAEKNPDKFHSTSAFEIETGKTLKRKTNRLFKNFWK